MSGWLDIGNCFFLCVCVCVLMDQDGVKVHKHAKENKAIMKQSLPSCMLK